MNFITIKMKTIFFSILMVMVMVIMMTKTVIIDDNDDAACLSRQVECVLLSQVVDVHLAEAA